MIARLPIGLFWVFVLSRLAFAEPETMIYKNTTNELDTLEVYADQWLSKGDMFSEVSLMGRYGVVVLGKENFPDQRTFRLTSKMSLQYMLTNKIGIGLSFEGDISSFYTSPISLSLMYDKLTLSSRMWTGEIFYGTSLKKSWINTGYSSHLYAGIGLGKRIESTLIIDTKNYSAYNQLFSYQYFIGFMKPLSKRVALGTRFERRIYSEPFEVEGLTQTIFLNDEVLNTWRRDVSLRFSFIYKW